VTTSIHTKKLENMVDYATHATSQEFNKKTAITMADIDENLVRDKGQFVVTTTRISDKTYRCYNQACGVGSH
jgi:hypothetical protein